MPSRLENDEKYVDPKNGDRQATHIKPTQQCLGRTNGYPKSRTVCRGLLFSRVAAPVVPQGWQRGQGRHMNIHHIWRGRRRRCRCRDFTKYTAE